MVHHVFRFHRIFQHIVSYRGPQFTPRVWRDEQVSLSSGFHPQTKGQVERARQEPEAALQCLASSNKATWSQPISWIEFAHNSLASCATGLSSFEVSLGYVCFQLLKVRFPSVQLHVRHCRRIWRATRAALLWTKEQNKFPDSLWRTTVATYHPGQKVWLFLDSDILRSESD